MTNEKALSIYYCPICVEAGVQAGLVAKHEHRAIYQGYSGQPPSDGNLQAFWDVVEKKVGEVSPIIKEALSKKVEEER